MQQILGSDTARADATGALASTCFVLWGFPEATQTFIHREFERMTAFTPDVQIAAAARRAPSSSATIERLRANALYLEPRWRWVARGLQYMTREPRRFARASELLASLRHRTAFHRSRAQVMVMAAAALADGVRARGVRYLHAHFGAYQAELTMALAELLDLPWGVTFHASDIWRDANALADKIAGARLVLTCTAHNAEHLRACAPRHASRIHLVRHGIDFAKLGAPAPYAPSDTPRLVAVGRLVPKKGFHHLIESAGELLRRGQPFRLSIVGEGSERAALQRRVRRLALDRLVTFTGALPNAQALAEIGRSHALIAPSVRDKRGDLDGIPNVILEAMALGRPVIGSALSGIPEVIRSGETGLLVTPGDAQALASAVQQLCADLSRAEAMGAAARDFVRSQFDLDANVEHQLALISRVCPGP